MASSSSSLPYRPALDGIRAFAVLGVLFYHLQLPWAVGGYLGVETFFVISGYLITSLLLRDYRLHGRLDLKRFWLRRARRLWPALWALLLGTFGLIIVLSPASLPRFLQDLPAAVFYYTNWLYIWQHIPYFERYAHPPVLQHLWSLAVEEQFYLLWPFLLWGLHRFFARTARKGSVSLGTALVTLGLAAASAAWMGWEFHTTADSARAYYGTDMRAAGFLLGGALAWVWPLRAREVIPSWVSRVAPWLGIIGLGSTLWIYAKVHEFTLWLYPWGFVWTAVSTLLMIFPSTIPGVWESLIGHPLLRWVGTRSYAIYLWHWPLIALFRPGAECRWPLTFCALGHLALTFLLAEWSYRVLETPIRRQGFRAWWRSLASRRWQLAAWPALLAAAMLFIAWRPWNHAAAASTSLAASATAMPSPSPPPAIALQPSPTSPAAFFTATPLPSSALTQEASATVLPDPTPSPSPTPAWTCYVTLLGDSVMARTYSTWMSHNNLYYQFYMDAQPKRLPTDLLDVIATLHRQGRLYHTVVLHIGTNALPNPRTLDGIMHQLVRLGVRKVYILNIRRPVGWANLANENIAQTAEQWPQAVLVDWHAAAQDNPQWFLDDGVHLTPTGAQAYVDLTLEAIQQYGCAP